MGPRSIPASKAGIRNGLQAVPINTILGIVCQGGSSMAHTREEKNKLLARVNRLQGQLESIRSAIAEERDSSDVLQQIAACRGAINSLLVEIIDGEIRFHVLSRNSRVDSREARAAENLVEILHRYIK